MRRFYLSQMTTDGSTDPPATDGLRPAVALYVSGYKMTDARADATQAGGWVLVESDVTTAEHNAIRADARNLPLPFEEAGTGRVLNLDESTDIMEQIDKDRVINRLEAIGVALHDFAGKTVRRVLVRIIRRVLVRQWLGPEDLPDGLDTTWGQLSSARRATIRDRLQAEGVDTVIINGPDPIRVVQQKILDQDIPAFQVAV